MNQLEGGPRLPLGQFQDPGKVAGLLVIGKAGPLQRLGGRRGIVRRKGGTLQTLSLSQKAIQAVDIEGRVDDPQDLDIVLREHHAVIGRPPADMTAARGHREPKPAPVPPGRLKVSGRHDHMIDAGGHTACHDRTHAIRTRTPAARENAAPPPSKVGQAQHCDGGSGRIAQ